MRVFKTSYRDRQGKLKRASKWYVEFRDQNDVIRRLPAFTSKPASEEFGRNLEKLVSYHRATGGQTEPSLQQWLETIPEAARDRLVEIKLLDSERVAVAKLLDSHLEDFGKALRAKGGTERHVELVTSRARKVIEGCGFRHYSQIAASAVLSYLNELRNPKDKKAKGISAQTFNFYLQAVKQFCRWMVKDRRATQTPLAHLQGLNVRTDRRHDRRPLSHDELCLLLDAAEHGSVRAKLGGPERSLLYRLAAETGLRAGELRSLSPLSFHLEGEEPTVTVSAAYSKNRRESTLPLKLVTAELLIEHLRGKAADGQAFAVPPREHVAKMMRDDLADARAKWLREAVADPKEHERRTKSEFLAYTDHRGRKADFHALRHTFITNLAEGGVHPKTAQMLARHSTFALTMERYSHTRREQETAALKVLRDLPRPSKKAAEASVSGESVLASCLAQPRTPGATDGDSVRPEGSEAAPAQAGAADEDGAFYSGEDDSTLEPLGATG